LAGAVADADGDGGTGTVSCAIAEKDCAIPNTRAAAAVLEIKASRNFIPDLFLYFYRFYNDEYYG
jgi:hypothetical protein